ncbi:MAG: hypothetical protein JKY61_00060 [Planctomycetes bacterium]|nr:hypothetical protein [Planctomycetota bacterium]
MIAVLDAANAPHIRLPLWNDPAVVLANWPDSKRTGKPTKAHAKALDDYINTGDATGLVVPSDATVVTIRALSAAEMLSAERAAGRKSQLGIVITMKRDKHVKTLEGDADAKIAAVAAWTDALSKEDYAALQSFSAWVDRSVLEVAKAATVHVTHPDLGECSLERFVGCIVDKSLQRHIIAEINYRAKAYAGLGIRPKGLSNSVNGSVRLTESAPQVTGSALNAMTDCDDNAATVAAASQTI